MSKLKLTEEVAKLIKQYQIMAQEGFERTYGCKIPAQFANNSFQLKKFRHICKDYFVDNNIETVLHYGGGGSS